MAMEVNRADRRLKEGLGWATLGLTAGLLAAPSQVARLIGAPDDERSRAALRAVGLRELAAYVLIERSGPTAAFPLWVRAGGDAIDLALLGLAARRRGADRTRLGVAAAISSPRSPRSTPTPRSASAPTRGPVPGPPRPRTT